MHSVTTTGHVEKGTLILVRRNQFFDRVKLFEGDSVKVTVTRTTKGRSTKQNRYYWGTVLPIIQSRIQEMSGDFHDLDTLHDMFKGMFNSLHLANPEGEIVVKIPQSTTQLSTKEFEDYLTNIRNWCHDHLDLVVPLPNESQDGSWT